MREWPPTPWQLRPYQLEALRRVSAAWAEGHPRTMIVLATGCHDRDQLVLRDDGTSIRAEDVREGDRLLGPDGTPRTVLSLVRGRAPMVEIVPVKGEPWIVDLDHVLTLVRVAQSSPPKYPSHVGGALVDVTVREWLTWSATQKHLHKLVRAERIERFAGDEDGRPVDPYFIGLVLGVGSNTSRGVALSKPDPEVAAACEAEAARWGLTLRTDGTPTSPTHHLVGTPGPGGNALLAELRRLGVNPCPSDRLSVPAAYRTAPAAERAQVLAGLLDANGHLTEDRRTYDYISASPALADDVAFIARSLGLAAYVSAATKRAQTGAEGTYYRVTISGETTTIPCRVARQIAEPRRQKKDVLRTGFDVRHLDEEREFFGWQLDGDRRYLLADFTITHNCGKTTTFSEIARRRAMAGRRPTLVLAHRIELVEQAVEELKRAGLAVDVESGDAEAFPFPMFPVDVVVATVQTLKGRRLEKWPPHYFDTVIADECAHAAAASWRAILDRFDSAMHLGVTATPDRGDGVAIGHVYPHLSYAYGIREGIDDGFLVPIRSLAIDTPSVDLSSVRTTKQEHGRDLSAEDLAAAMRGEEQLHEIAAPIAREAGRRQTLIFVPSVEIAHALAEVLTPYVGKGLVKSLDGSTERATRDAVVQAYKAGDVQMLVNCALYTEGFNAPNTSCVAVARPTKSRALYTQMVGRGTRSAPGTIDHLGNATPEERRAAIAASSSPDCLVLNLRPDVCAHSLISPTDLFDGDELPDDIAREVTKAVERGEPVLQTIAKAEEAAREREAARQRERDRARIVADVHYRKYEQDPFSELGIDGPTARESAGPRASERMVAWLTNAGIPNAEKLSRREAAKVGDELARRRRQGLCSLRQMRRLTKSGLRGDLTFEEAGKALDALAANRWKVSPQIAERWGATG